MALILNQSQAEAVYRAMCALNNVGGRMTCLDLGPQRRDPQFRVTEAGTVIIETGAPLCEREVHDSRFDFAAAYGLQQA